MSYFFGLLQKLGCAMNIFIYSYIKTQNILNACYLKLDAKYICMYCVYIITRYIIIIIIIINVFVIISDIFLYKSIYYELYIYIYICGLSQRNLHLSNGHYSVSYVNSSNYSKTSFKVSNANLETRHNLKQLKHTC